MKKIIFLSLAATLISNLSFATIRRIQYWGTAVTGVDYATGTAAVAASAAGDTIMVFQSANESFSIDRRLVIIGPGSLNWSGVDANFNANLQNVQPASSAYYAITFAAGSDGTLVTGCNLAFTTSGTAPINNIKIRNCTNTAGYWTIGNGTNITYDSWEFSKCFFPSYNIQNGGTGSKITNIKLFNCIAASNILLGLSSTLGQTGIVENCTLLGTGLILSSNLFLIQNCIFYNPIPNTYTNSVFNNCLFASTPSPAITGSNNVFNAVPNNLFIGYPVLGSNSLDNRFQLKAGSPAIGAGIGGIDCGAYGGVNPYKLSMIPAVPAFYKLTATGTAAASNPYQITFSVRANN